MDKKVKFCLLILCGILSHGISALSKENGSSEDLHIRKKRLIGSDEISLRSARHVVNILANGGLNCVASLLSPGFAITATHCFSHAHQPRYSMLSGSQIPDSGIHHNITDIIRHPGFDSPLEDPHDLSLITFLPLINERSRNRPIKLYSGVLPPNSRGTATSWGRHNLLGGQRQFPKQLRSVTMSIISLDECRRLYMPMGLSITNHFICTFENGDKQCDIGDSGAPLVVNGHLVGVLSWNVDYYQPFPDVFMNLMHHDYRAWISRYVPSALEHN